MKKVREVRKLVGTTKVWDQVSPTSATVVLGPYLALSGQFRFESLRGKSQRKYSGETFLFQHS